MLSKMANYATFIQCPNNKLKCTLHCLYVTPSECSLKNYSSENTNVSSRICTHIYNLLRQCSDGYGGCILSVFEEKDVCFLLEKHFSSLDIIQWGSLFKSHMLSCSVPSPCPKL